MKTRKHYAKVCALLLMLVTVLTACGDKSTDKDTTKDTTSSNSEAAADNNDTTEDNSEAATGNTDEPAEAGTWEGVQSDLYGYTGEGTSYKYVLLYPTLRPGGSNASLGFAWQHDPALAISGTNGEDIHPVNVEDVLPACLDQLAQHMEYYRGSYYSDFQFNIETTEPMTIKDYPACKYTGTHSFVFENYDGESTTYEIPFVAYSKDLQIDSESYVYVMVLDESALIDVDSSLNHVSREPVAAGALEYYAYKMALTANVSYVID